MLTQAVETLQQRKREVRDQVRQLEKEARQIEKAIAAIAELGGAKPSKAGKPAKAGKRRKMSKLGRLKIKLGSLNRYGKKEEAKVVEAQIAKLLGK